MNANKNCKGTESVFTMHVYCMHVTGIEYNCHACMNVYKKRLQTNPAIPSMYATVTYIRFSSNQNPKPGHVEKVYIRYVSAPFLN